MIRKRSGETEQETNECRVCNRQNMIRKRSGETGQESNEYRACNRQNMTTKRCLETEQETNERRAYNRQNMAKTRSNETIEKNIEHKAKNKWVMANARNAVKPVDSIVKEFQAKVKVGPEYVCTSCHRMMYKHSVVTFKPTKHTKASPELLELISCLAHVTNGKQWICMSCDRSLCRGVLPVQSKANGMELDNHPPELSCLNAPEQRLISLRVPFMKMVALPCGKQSCIHGPAVNVPSKVDRVCTMLPRLPSGCELAPLKLKRKLSYNGHYLYDYVSPEELTKALKWLKANNPLYADIAIADDWGKSALADDEELLMGMSDQLEQPDTGESNAEHTNVPHGVVNVVGSCVDISITDNDVLYCTNVLEQFARQHELVIHDVPRDGIIVCLAQ